MHSVSVCFAHINEWNDFLVNGEYIQMIFDAVSKTGVLFPFKSIFCFLFYFFIYSIFLFWLPFLIKVCVFSSISISFGTFFTHCFLWIFWILKFWNYFHIHGHLCIFCTAKVWIKSRTAEIANHSTNRQCSVRLSKQSYKIE